MICVEVLMWFVFLFSSRRRHTICALVTGVQTCALPISALVSIVEGAREHLQPDPEVEANPAAHYDQVLELDLSTLEPHIVGPHTPDRARPLSALAAEVADPANGFVDAISSALIGSCTNSSYEDKIGRAHV